MENVDKSSKNRFSLCLLLLLATILLINLLSSYIRHAEAGLGCADWPACYGVVGELATASERSPLAALTPTESAKQAHRTIATILVVLVLWTLYQARSLPLRGSAQFLPYLLLATIILLSVIGPASYLKTLPAIASVNLLGGMALLLLTWWLWLEIQPPAQSVVSLRLWANAALSLLLLQITLGAWVSANFAATACSGLWQCAADENSNSLVSSFWYFRELKLDTLGRVVMDNSQTLIAKTHQLGAAVTTLLLTLFSLLAMRARGLMARWGLILLCLLAIQVALGISALHFGLPLAVVLAHNLVASLLLMTVLRMKLLTRSQTATAPVRMKTS